MAFAAGAGSTGLVIVPPSPSGKFALTDAGGATKVTVTPSSVTLAWADPSGNEPVEIRRATGLKPPTATSGVQVASLVNVGGTAFEGGTLQLDAQAAGNFGQLVGSGKAKPATATLNLHAPQ